MVTAPEAGVTDMPRLRADNLSLQFGTSRVLDRVSIELRAGWTAVVGPNGAGKSTLLRCLAGLLRPDEGDVFLDGRRLADWSETQRGQQIAWLAQQSDTQTDLTSREVASLGRLPHTGLFKPLAEADELAVTEALEASESRPWEHRILLEQSGGERQRTLLARALAVQASILLLDEPTAHLDPPHQVSLVRLMRKLGQQGTVVSVLHDLNLALQADRLVVMADGQIMTAGPSADEGVQAALVSVFGGAISIRQIGSQWLAVPEI